MRHTTALYWDYVAKDLPIEQLEMSERKVA
jgi:hypothetical protein